VRLEAVDQRGTGGKLLKENVQRAPRLRNGESSEGDGLILLKNNVFSGEILGIRGMSRYSKSIGEKRKDDPGFHHLRKGERGKIS